ncbi:MAG: hypothetical protein QXJ26_00490 [Desulfurococcaceae archaeon]
MLTRRDVLKAVRRFHNISDAVFNACLNALLQILSNDELVYLALCSDDVYLQMKAVKVLEKRGIDITEYAVKHNKGIHGKNTRSNRSGRRVIVNKCDDKRNNNLHKSKQLQAKGVV